MIFSCILNKDQYKYLLNIPQDLAIPSEEKSNNAKPNHFAESILPNLRVKLEV